MGKGKIIVERLREMGLREPFLLQAADEMEWLLAKNRELASVLAERLLDEMRRARLTQRGWADEVINAGALLHPQVLNADGLPKTRGQFLDEVQALRTPDGDHA